MDNLVLATSRENLSDAFLHRMNSRIVELEKELSALHDQKQELEKNYDSALDREMQIEVLSAALGSLHNNFDTLSIQDKRTLVQLLVDKIVWDGENLHIFIYGE